MAAEIWRAKCLKTDIGPSPVFADGKVFAANDNCNLSAIRADGHGDVTASGVLWKGEDGLPDTCSPLATKEFVLLLTSFGTLTCYDAAKGDMLWAEDFSTDFSASPSLVGNRVYLIGKKGKAVDRRAHPAEVQAGGRGRSGRGVRYQSRLSGRTDLSARQDQLVLSRQIAACGVAIT